MISAASACAAELSTVHTSIELQMTTLSVCCSGLCCRVTCRFKGHRAGVLNCRIMWLLTSNCDVNCTVIHQNHVVVDYKNCDVNCTVIHQNDVVVDYKNYDINCTVIHQNCVVVDYRNCDVNCTVIHQNVGAC